MAFALMRSRYWRCYCRWRSHSPVAILTLLASLAFAGGGIIAAVAMRVG